MSFEVGGNEALEDRIAHEWNILLKTHVKGIDSLSTNPPTDFSLRHIGGAFGVAISVIAYHDFITNYYPHAPVKDHMDIFFQPRAIKDYFDGLIIGYSLGEIVDSGRNIVKIIRDDRNTLLGKIFESSKYLLTNSRLCGISVAAAHYHATGYSFDSWESVGVGVIAGGIHSGVKRFVQRKLGSSVDRLTDLLARKPIVHGLGLTTAIYAFIDQTNTELIARGSPGMGSNNFTDNPLYLPVGVLSAYKEWKGSRFDVPTLLKYPSTLSTGVWLATSAYGILTGDADIVFTGSNMAALISEVTLRGVRNAYLYTKYNELKEIAFKDAWSLKETLAFNANMIWDTLKMYGYANIQAGQRALESAVNLFDRIYSSTTGFLSIPTRTRRNDLLLNMTLPDATRVSTYMLQAMQSNSFYGTKKISCLSGLDILRRCTFFERISEVFWDTHYALHGRLSDKLILASRLASRGEHDKAITIMDNLKDKYPSNAYVNIARGYFVLHGTGNSVDLEDAVDELLRDKNIASLFMQSIEGTRNDVKVYSGILPALDMLVVRKISKNLEALDTERANIEFYAKYNPQSLPIIVGDLRSTDHGFEMRQLHHGTSVYEYLGRIHETYQSIDAELHQKQYALVSAVNLLTDLQKSYFAHGKILDVKDTVHLTTYESTDGGSLVNYENDKPQFFKRRIHDVLIDRYASIGQPLTYGQALLDNYDVVNDHLTSIENNPHYLDYNLRNVMLLRGGNAGKIDIEGRRSFPALIDLVNILEFERSYLSDELRDTIINLYLNEMKSHFGNEDYTELRMDYSYSALHRHLELVGYRIRDFSAAKDSDNRFRNLFYTQHHIEYAVSHINYLLEKDTSLNDDQIRQLTGLRGILRNDNFVPEMIRV